MAMGCKNFYKVLHSAHQSGSDLILLTEVSEFALFSSASDITKLTCKERDRGSNLGDLLFLFVLRCSCGCQNAGPLGCLRRNKT